MNVGSLFSGIGGFDLGLERAGMRTVWFCEQDDYCRRVLAKHWPGVPCHPDVRSLVGDPEGNGCRPRGQGRPAPAGEGQPESALRDGVPVSVPSVDVLCGGFPCQDLSYAGTGAGIDGERSGLWSEYARLVGELRPRYVVVENVPALLGRGLGRVLGDLAALGYDAEWDCIPASAFGAPHRRDRIWLIAYPNADSGGREIVGKPQPAGFQHLGHVADGLREAGQTGALPHPNGTGSQGHGRPEQRAGEQPPAASGAANGTGELADTSDIGHQRPRPARNGGLGLEDGGGRGYAEWWIAEPNVGRVANGVPSRVDRLRSLGNALVPQIAEWIGLRIMEYEAQTREVAACSLCGMEPTPAGGRHGLPEGACPDSCHRAPLTRTGEEGERF